MDYKVEWHIEIDAPTAQQAAEVALAIQRDPASTATVFIVTDEKGKQVTVDLGFDERLRG